MAIKRTGNDFPQPARIIITKRLWVDVGGVRGWESVGFYDRNFEDWDYAYAVYDEILNRADEVW